MKRVDPIHWPEALVWAGLGFIAAVAVCAWLERGVLSLFGLYTLLP